MDMQCSWDAPTTVAEISEVRGRAARGEGESQRKGKTGRDEMAKAVTHHATLKQPFALNPLPLSSTSPLGVMGRRPVRS